MEEDKKWCVYKHTNILNKKVYIGITSQSPTKRWGRGSNYKNNPYFYRAIQKYGWDNFKHEILFNNLCQDEACSKEKELIRLYNSTNKNNGYNITLGGEGTLGVSHVAWNKGLTKKDNPKLAKGIISEDTRRKLREANIGKHQTEETKQKLRDVRLGSKLTEETKEKISVALKQSAYFKGKELPQITRQKAYEANIKKVFQYDMSGKLINSFNSHIEAAQFLDNNGNIKRIKTICSCISDACLGNTRSAYGYFWSHEKHDIYTIPNKQKRKVCQIKEKRMINIFDSLTEASMKTGINCACICECCKGRQKTAGGYIWRYTDEVENDTLEVV